MKLMYGHVYFGNVNQWIIKKIDKKLYLRNPIIYDYTFLIYDCTFLFHDCSFFNLRCQFLIEESQCLIYDCPIIPLLSVRLGLV